VSIFLRKLNIAHNIFCKYTYKKEITKYFQKIFFKISALKKRKKEKIYIKIK